MPLAHNFDSGSVGHACDTAICLEMGPQYPKIIPKRSQLMNLSMNVPTVGYPPFKKHAISSTEHCMCRGKVLTPKESMKLGSQVRIWGGAAILCEQRQGSYQPDANSSSTEILKCKTKIEEP